jgi:hypothetical protein
MDKSVFVSRRNRGVGIDASPVSFSVPPTPILNIRESVPLNGEASMATVQTSLKLLQCEMCKRLVLHLDSHHAIPRFMGGDDTDIIQVCRSCHRKSEIKFVNFLLDPWGKSIGKYWDDKNKRIEYAKQYMPDYHRTLNEKTIFSIKFEDICRLRIRLHYSQRTGHISYSTKWKIRRVKFEKLQKI